MLQELRVHAERLDVYTIDDAIAPRSQRPPGPVGSSCVTETR